MKRLTHVASATLFVAVLMMCGLACAASVAALYDSAKRVIPERDLAPLIAVLRAPGSTDELRAAIDKIETLGSGSSPAAAKHYLLEQPTPLLLKVGKNGPAPFARG